MIAFSELTDDLRPALLAASSRHFGSGSYQSDDGYLRWLYQINPTSRGLRDCVVAVQDDAVVGCMHRLMLPMGGGCRLAALHNHFVEPSARSGSGVLLLRRSTRDTDVAVAPGVEEKLAPIYQRLRFHELEGAWLQKPLSHLRIAAGLMRGRLGGDSRLTIRVSPPMENLVLTTSPTVNQLAELCFEMQRREATGGVDWSPELVGWRYFDPRGPRHLLVRSRRSAAYAVVALGKRMGVRTMRLMDFWAAGRPDWLAMVERVARRSGAALGLAFTTDAATRAELQAGGWRPRAGKTFTFATSGLSHLSAAATDLGFEAFRAEFR